MYRSGYRRHSYWGSVLGLVGHLAGTAVIFMVFLGLVWVVALFLHWLNAIHPLPVEIYGLVTKFEVGLVYIDAVLCLVVLIAGLIRFVREVVNVG